MGFGGDDGLKMHASLISTSSLGGSMHDNPALVQRGFGDADIARLNTSMVRLEMVHERPRWMSLTRPTSSFMQVERHVVTDDSADSHLLCDPLPRNLRSALGLPPKIYSAAFVRKWTF